MTVEALGIAIGGELAEAVALFAPSLRCESVGGLKGVKMKEVGEMGEEEVGLEGGVGEEGDGVGGGRGEDGEMGVEGGEE